MASSFIISGSVSNFKKFDVTYFHTSEKIQQQKICLHLRSAYINWRHRFRVADDKAFNPTPVETTKCINVYFVILCLCTRIQAHVPIYPSPFSKYRSSFRCKQIIIFRLIFFSILIKVIRLLSEDINQFHSVKWVDENKIEYAVTKQDVRSDGADQLIISLFYSHPLELILILIVTPLYSKRLIMINISIIFYETFYLSFIFQSSVRRFSILINIYIKNYTHTIFIIHYTFWLENIDVWILMMMFLFCSLWFCFLNRTFHD